jgi:6-pyruvoyltetrahydropterin/6-carboxytetrahydropterin synthase
MHRLTREVRLTLTEPPAAGGKINGHAGWPAVERLAPWVAVRVTVAGEPDERTGYLLNIAEVDRAVRERCLPALREAVGRPIATLPATLTAGLRESFPGRATLHAIEVRLSPFTAVAAVTSELPMIRLSHRFEFAASHRLHVASLGDDENRRAFGKCNNPHGHGHNYELEVTLSGEPDAAGTLIPLGEIERIVNERVIAPLDHKNLNVEVEEFSTANPTVENIAAAIFRRLEPSFATSRARLAKVTVWETPKTWCEYGE